MTRRRPKHAGYARPYDSVNDIFPKGNRMPEDDRPDYEPVNFFDEEPKKKSNWFVDDPEKPKAAQIAASIILVALAVGIAGIIFFLLVWFGRWAWGA